MRSATATAPAAEEEAANLVATHGIDTLGMADIDAITAAAATIEGRFGGR